MFIMAYKSVWWCCLLTAQFTVSGTLTAYYLSSPCGTKLSLGRDSPLSFQLESDTGLVYANNLDCTVAISAPTGNVVLATIKRFELEPSRSGTCRDYVNLHDGDSVGSATLNSDVMCGSAFLGTTYVSAGGAMTLHFVTDSTAVYLGFNIIFTAATSGGTCGDQQTRCNNSYCVPSQYSCDNYDQCGDSSDESQCASTPASAPTSSTPLIVGLTLGGLLLLLLLLAYVIYRRHRSTRWKKFQNEHIERDDLPDLDPTYPVTRRYFRGIRGHPDVDTDPGEKPSYDAVTDRGGKMTSSGEQKKPASS